MLLISSLIMIDLYPAILGSVNFMNAKFLRGVKVEPFLLARGYS
jgi:hypothetical protein